ncbi:MAG: dihydroorotate dehydrogenase [Oscillospiraceae bacterium]|nr:dihydroorotate dehydrogenase [Oscillospiraceae bacterium]
MAAAPKAVTSVTIAGITFRNVVIAASGTFGYGREFAGFIDLSALGGVCTKAVTLEPREGNPPPRVAETPSGILNSIGLQNPGLEAFIRDELPFLLRSGTKVIANVAGRSAEEYAAVAGALGGAGVDAVELNVSCPNVSEGCMAFGTSPKATERLTREVKEACAVPVFVKLSPNVSDIAEMALAAEAGGADAITMVNTLLGMAVDIKTGRPVLGNVTGGLSGPCIKPVALRMVYEVCMKVGVPVIGMGGIAGYEDALEFLMVGARAVMVGTAGLCDPYAHIKCVEGLERYMGSNGIGDVGELVGLALP